MQLRSKKVLKQMSKILFAAMLTGSIALFAACNHSGSEPSSNADSTAEATTPADSLQTVLLSIHEVTMGKIGAMRQASADLKHMKDSLKMHSPKIDSLISKLSRTDSSMFNWMQNFDLNKDTSDQARRVTYLQEQLTIVTGIKDSMLSGIDSANAILKK
jgi:hypothetical protein